MKPGLFIHSPHVPGLRLPSPAELWGARHRNCKWAGTLASPPVWAKNGHGVSPKLQSDSQTGTERRWKFSALVMTITGINKIWCWTQYQSLLYYSAFSKGFPVVLLSLPEGRKFLYLLISIMSGHLGCITPNPAPQHLVNDQRDSPNIFMICKTQQPPWDHTQYTWNTHPLWWWSRQRRLVQKLFPFLSEMLKKLMSGHWKLSDLAWAGEILHTHS